MEGPRLTEERLRHHLDGRQPEREAMCLALLPLLGSYTREQPRRPKGGPDGGRDLEALFDGSTVVWGAVGFRNGGGNDGDARTEAEKKFRADLQRMLDENTQLDAFVFFTNVDLTPTIRDDLKVHARSLGINYVDIFDFERLRHVLDTPEGLIPRLQHLGIPMSETEQLGLMSKFGNELQRVVTTGLDRIERTLDAMDNFMAFQRPILRIEAYIQFTQPITSAELGDSAIAIQILGLRDLTDSVMLFCGNETSHAESKTRLVFRLSSWIESKLPRLLRHSFIAHDPHVNRSEAIAMALGMVPLQRVGSQHVRLIDLTFLKLDAICTKAMRPLLKKLSIDVNGYELFSCSPNDDYSDAVDAPQDLPEELAFANAHHWVHLCYGYRDCFFDPPRRSGRLAPLMLRMVKTAK